MILTKMSLLLYDPTKQKNFQYSFFRIFPSQYKWAMESTGYFSTNEWSSLTYLTVSKNPRIYSFHYKGAHVRHEAFFIVLLINIIIHLAFIQVIFQIPDKSSEKDSLAIHIH